MKLLSSVRFRRLVLHWTQLLASTVVSHTPSSSKPVTVAIPHLTMNMKIMDDNGVEQMTLGSLMNSFADLKSEVARLGAAVVAQGGVKIGDVVYSSEDELRVHVMDLTNHELDGLCCFR